MDAIQLFCDLRLMCFLQVLLAALKSQMDREPRPHCTITEVLKETAQSEYKQEEHAVQGNGMESGSSSSFSLRSKGK